LGFLEEMAMSTGFEIELSEEGAHCRLFRAAAADTPRGSLAGIAHDPDLGTACVLVGRLYYKDDVARTFPRLAGRSFNSDAALALAVFGVAGPAALPKLEGEFSLAVYDPARRAVFAYRDPLGSWPLYHGSENGVLRVGTGLLNLARPFTDVRINRDFLGTFLMWPFASAELAEPQTALHPLRRVLPGELVQLSAEGPARTLQTHAWPSQAESSAVTADEAGARFAELFRMAVKQRLEPGTPVAHLSGGMDSSAVVCVARDLLAGQPLSALSLVFGKNSLAAETDWIRLVLDQKKRAIDSRFLDGDALLDFDWFEQGVPEHDEPYTMLFQLGMQRHLGEAADASGAATILTGFGAEAVAEGLPYGLADQVRRLHWRTAMAEARRWAQAGNESVRTVLWRDGIEPLLPTWLRDGVWALWHNGRARWPHVGMSSVPPWVQPGFARGHDLWAKGQAAMRRVFAPPYERTANVSMANGMAGDWGTWHLTGPRGLHTARPFLDPRLVGYCLTLPASLRLTPGLSKPLLRSAMRGILPEPIRSRRLKGHFNDVFRLGLGRQLGRLEDMVRQSPIAEMDLLDNDSLCQALHQTAAGVGEMTAANRLNSTLALVAWYDHLGPALRRPADEPTETLALRTHEKLLNNLQVGEETQGQG
jgi:asparagine synthase (glutamine-hydrolysing)